MEKLKIIRFICVQFDTDRIQMHHSFILWVASGYAVGIESGKQQMAQKSRWTISAAATVDHMIFSAAPVNGLRFMDLGWARMVQTIHKIIKQNLMLACMACWSFSQSPLCGSTLCSRLCELEILRRDWRKWSSVACRHFIGFTGEKWALWFLANPRYGFFNDSNWKFFIYIYIFRLVRRCLLPSDATFGPKNADGWASVCFFLSLSSQQTGERTTFSLCKLQQMFLSS